MDEEAELENIFIVLNQVLDKILALPQSHYTPGAFELVQKADDIVASLADTTKRVERQKRIKSVLSDG